MLVYQMTKAQGQKCDQFNSITTTTIPNHILRYLSHKFDCNNNAKVKQYFILEQECISAQQRVFIIRVIIQQEDEDAALQLQIPKDWNDAIQNGCHRIVIRIWKGYRRWWNLNHTITTNTAVNNNSNDDNCWNDDDAVLSQEKDWKAAPSSCYSLDPNSIDAQQKERQHYYNDIASQEIWGYQTARDALSTICRNGDGGCDNRNCIYIPQILYFSLWDANYNENLNISNCSKDYLSGSIIRNNDDNENHNNCSDELENDNEQDYDYPWAIIEYVGSESNLLKRINSDDKDCDYKNKFQYDDTWMRKMTKHRTEYGFPNEEHLRWGRIPVSDCIEYTETVLRSIIVPLHQYCFHHHETLFQNNLSMKAITYMDMVKLYKTKFHDHIIRYQPKYPDDDQYSLNSMTNKKDHALNKYDSDSCSYDTTTCNNSKMHTAIVALGHAIDRLEEEVTLHAMELSCPKPVLCHMDFQPQNLIFTKVTSSEGQNQPQSSSSSLTSPWFILSVLDWEEAAYADPRFELLLLCRKVCANRQQADSIWDLYHSILKEQNHNNDNQWNSIEPWLKLELVHNITTLMLQIVSSDGGRNSWETKSEMIDKIERDFQRLVWMGWDFCNVTDTITDPMERK